MLNKTKITATVCAFALMMGTGISAFAANNTPAKGEIKQRIELTDEQKAEFEAKRAEMETKREEQKAKWDALTEEQKNEIYALHDQIADLKGKIVDKYVEFGVLDATESETEKTLIEERKTKMRENGGMPMGRGEKHIRIKNVSSSELANN